MEEERGEDGGCKICFVDCQYLKYKLLMVQTGWVEEGRGGDEIMCYILLS